MSSEHDTTVDNEDSETLDSTADKSATSELLSAHDVLSAIPIDAYESLPAPVKRRVKALKNLQLQVTNLEAKFYEEVHLLECKYNKLYYPIHEKRHNIVTGLYEPTDAESLWTLDDDNEDLSKDLEEKALIEEISENKAGEGEPDSTTVVGVPLFWLTAFKNVSLIADMIQPCDEPILASLIDVKSILLESDPMGFVLEFHFSPNEYFSNSVLTKEYEMKCSPDANDPFSFEGPEIVKCKGCKIDWKKGKNVTVKQVKKKQKHKNRSQVTRTVVKTVQNDSFFHFFSPPEICEESDSESYDETQALLTSDFEIGHLIRERVVPNAVLFFTGEAIDPDEYEEEEEEEEEEEDDDYEEESDLDEKEESPAKKSDENPKRRGGRRASGPAQNAKAANLPPGNNTECKQQ